MTKEMKAFITLVVSLITFVLLLPIMIIIGVLRALKSILNIVDKTLTFFINSIREELLKQ
jgi:uncharacterized membrane protein